MDSSILNYAKIPIPVLNNTLPHSYVIMPALLAHIDSNMHYQANMNVSKYYYHQSNNSSNNITNDYNQNQKFYQNSSKKIINLKKNKTDRKKAEQNIIIPSEDNDENTVEIFEINEGNSISYETDNISKYKPEEKLSAHKRINSPDEINLEKANSIYIDNLSTNSLNENSQFISQSKTVDQNEKNLDENLFDHSETSNNTLKILNKKLEKKKNLINRSVSLITMGFKNSNCLTSINDNSDNSFLTKLNEIKNKSFSSIDTSSLINSTSFSFQKSTKQTANSFLSESFLNDLSSKNCMENQSQADHLEIENDHYRDVQNDHFLIENSSSEDCTNYFVRTNSNLIKTSSLQELKKNLNTNNNFLMSNKTSTEEDESTDSDESAYCINNQKEKLFLRYDTGSQSENQLNLNRMFGCYVLFRNIKTNLNNANYLNKIKLKCSVCKKIFLNLNELVEHKELNDTCKNEIQIYSKLNNIDANNINNNNCNNRQSNLNSSSFIFNSLINKSNKTITSKNLMQSSCSNSNKGMVKKSADLKNLKLDLVSNFFEDEEVFDLDDNTDSVDICDNEEIDLDNEVEIIDNIENSDDNDDDNVDDIDDIDDDGEDDCFEDYYEYLDGHSNLKDKNTRNKKNIENKSNKKLVNCSSYYLNNELIQTDLTDKIQKKKESSKKPRRKYNKNKNNPKTSLSCECCNKACRTKAELLVHMHKHAGNEPECWECGKKCASFSNLVSHVQLHTGEKPYACQFCGKQFTQDAHLTRHIRLHTGERPFVCNLCGKNYKDYSYYKTHLRIHRGERLYKCNYCNKGFYDASYYKKHTRLHTGEKPYMCTVCGRQFHRSDYLKLHSYSHTDERPFNCHICGKGFKMNYNLKIHLEKHENDLSHAIISSNEETTYLNEPLDLNNNNNNNNVNFINTDNLVCSIQSSNLTDNTISFNLINLSSSSSETRTDLNTNEIVSFLINNHELNQNDQQQQQEKLDMESIAYAQNLNKFNLIEAAAANTNLNELDVSLMDENQNSIIQH